LHWYKIVKIRGVESESGFWLRVGVSHLKKTPTVGCICFIWAVCNFVAVYLDFCAIYFTTKTLYTIVYLLLEEYKISLKSFLSTQSLYITQ